MLMILLWIIESIAALSEENAASTQEISASTEEVSAQVGDLNESAATLALIARELQSSTAPFKLFNDVHIKSNGNQTC